MYFSPLRVNLDDNYINSGRESHQRIIPRKATIKKQVLDLTPLKIYNSILKQAISIYKNKISNWESVSKKINK